MGRVIVHLQDHDATSYRDLILYACLNNTTYDTQVEGYKTDYMMDIINLTDEPDYYRSEILTAAKSIADDDSWQAGYLLDLMTAFAKQGDNEARQFIYDYGERTIKDEDSRAVSAIIEIDGIDGFTYVLNKINPLKNKQNDFYWYEGLLWELEEVMGESEANNTLDTLRKTNKHVNDYLTTLEEKKRDLEARRSTGSTPPKVQRYADVKERIAKYGISSKWDEEASPEDLLAAAQDLIQLDDPLIALRYLRLFRRTPFPLDPQLLFRFIDMEYPHPYFSMASATISVLQNLSYPSIRELAFKLINDGKYTERAVRLLARNFELSDWKLIEKMSEQQLDDPRYHDLQWSVQDVFEQHPDPIARQTLLNIYEYGPCMNCRESVLEMMASIDAIPEQVRKECLYDANEDIRELAQNDFITNK